MANIAAKVLWSETANPSDRYRQICDACRNIPYTRRVDRRCRLAWKFRNGLNLPPTMHVHPEASKLNPIPLGLPCWESNFLVSGELGVKAQRIGNPSFTVGDMVVVVTRNELHAHIPKCPVVAIGRIHSIFVTSSHPIPRPSILHIRRVPPCAHGAGEVTMVKLDPLMELLTRGIHIDHRPYFNTWTRPLYKKIDYQIPRVIGGDLLQQRRISRKEYDDLFRW